jgi:PKD repeat protein
MSVRELFRLKLGDAEVVPTPLVRTKLMRKLARQEFLHFNPGHFNIYYFGGILAAVITSSLFFLPVSRNSDQQKVKVSNEIPAAQKQEAEVSSAQQPVAVKPYISDKKASESIRMKPETKKSAISANTVPEKNIRHENLNTSPNTISDSIAKKVLFSEPISENKLQNAGIKTEASFEISAREGCAPLKLSFINKSGSPDSCRWTFGDGGYSFEKNPKWIFDVEGEYKVVLSVFGSDGSVATSSSTVNVYPRPVARFEISPEKAVLPRDEIVFYNYSTNGTNFNWDFGDGTTSTLFEPRHKYGNFGNYNVRLVVSSDNGCSDSLIVLNAFSGSEYFIDMPNAFIPNPLGPSGGFYSAKSDEGAQVFHPSYSGVSDYQLKIFSKIGILIFETNDINIGWDGYYKGQLINPGVYIWKVRGNFRNGEPFIKMGDVTLLRN